MDRSKGQHAEPWNRQDGMAGATWRGSPAFQRSPSVTPTCELPVAKVSWEGTAPALPVLPSLPPRKKPWEDHLSHHPDGQNGG